MNKQAELKIYGRVQKVMYRDWASRKAKELELTGWVKNEADGTVKIVAEGEEKDLNQFIERCYNGPALADVVKIDTKWRRAENQFKSFKIIYQYESYSPPKYR